jgi:hypothetical protein
MRRDEHQLYADVVGELRVEPTASANEIDRRLRAAGAGRWRNDVLEAVRLLRSLPGVAQSGRGPGRPRKTVRTRESGLRGDVAEVRSSHASSQAHDGVSEEQSE